MAADIVTLGKLGIGTGDPVNTRLDFADFDLGIAQQPLDTNGTRGSYDADFGRIRLGLIEVAPTFRSQPTTVELAAILAWAMGGTPTGSPTVSYPMANAVALRNVHFDPGDGTLWKLTDVGVDTMTLSASEGSPLDVALSLVGRTYARTGSFPAIDLDISTQPFIFSDCALTVNGTGGVQARDFSYTLSNGIDRGRYFNNNNLTALNKLNRTHAVNLTVPFGDYAALFAAGINATGAVGSVVATFTNGGSVLTITLSNVAFPPVSPDTPFQQEAFLPISGMCYRSSLSTFPVAITLKPS